MNPTTESEIVHAIQDQQRWLDLPTMTEDEILEVEIPEDRQFRSLRVNYNGNPCSVRIVRSRDGSVSLNVDFVQNLFYVHERINRLLTQLGQLRLEELQGSDG